MRVVHNTVAVFVFRGDFQGLLGFDNDRDSGSSMNLSHKSSVVVVVRPSEDPIHVDPKKGIAEYGFLPPSEYFLVLQPSSTEPMRL